MLDTLRNGAKSWIAKLLLSLLILSFVAWGISDVFRQQLTGNEVVTAGKTGVTLTEFRLAYARQLQVLQNQIGQRLTQEQAKAFNVDGQVLQQMIAGAVLDEEARNLNLGLSKDRLAELTGDDPAFKTQSGTFSRAVFDMVLRNVGMRPEDYLRSREKTAVRQQIVEAVSEGTKIPDVYLAATALHDGESRTVDYVAIPASAIPAVDTVDEAALKKFFEDRKDSYKAPEYRKFTYVRLLPDDIADEKSISDADVQADYDKNKQRYTTAETRVIEQLVFADAAAAKAASDKIKSGTPFETIVTEQGKKLADISLGTLKKSDIPDAKIADAAYALAQGVVSDPVDGTFGPVLLRVTGIQPEIVKPFDVVKAEIRKALATAAAANIILDVHDQYEDERGGGASLQEAATKLNLKPVTVESADTSGLANDGKPIAALPEQQALLTAVFDAEEGAENAPLNVNPAGFIWYEVEKVTAERERPLEELRDKVVADWKAAKLNENLAAKADEYKKAIMGGKSLDEIATELKLEKKTRQGVKRGSEDTEFSIDAVQAAFGGALGHVAAVANATGDQQIIMKVTEVFAPAATGADAASPERKNSASAGIADDILEQLVAKLQETYPVTINQAALNASVQAAN